MGHRDGVWGNFDGLQRDMVQRLARSIVFLFISCRGRCSVNEFCMLQVLSYCGILLQLWIFGDTLTFAAWVGASVLTRVILAIFVGNVPLTMLLNVGHVVGMSARVLSSDHHEELAKLLTLELITCIVAVGLSASLEYLLRRQMMATLEASLATASERTASELLSLM